MEKVLENVDVAGICVVAATAFSGMFAGGSLYINTVHIPSLKKMKSTACFRDCWKEMFLFASKYQVSQ